MNVTFHGSVSLGSAYRHAHALKKGHIWIGECDILRIISTKRWKKRVYVTVTLPTLTRRFFGESYQELGYSFSSNQQEKDCFMVGKYNILSIISHYEHTTITLTISDEECTS